MVDSSPNGSKTLWEKEKLLVTSNFSFSHGVFEILVLRHVKTRACLGKGYGNQSIINPLPDDKF